MKLDFGKLGQITFLEIIDLSKRKNKKKTDSSDASPIVYRLSTVDDFHYPGRYSGTEYRKEITFTIHKN